MSTEPSQPTVPPEPPPPPGGSSFLTWGVIGGLCILLLAGSWFFSRHLSNFDTSRQGAPPVYRMLREDLQGAERLGGTRSLEELRGKAVVIAYAYTRCPRGCAGVAAQMLKLRDAFAGDDRLHFVSLAVWPKIDTPEVLSAYAESIGVREDDPWWWLTVDRDTAWKFMEEQIGFEPSREIPAEERLNPEDVVFHDLRAALIDPQGRVRTFYAVMHPQTGAAEMALDKLKRDITLVLQGK